MEPEGFFAFTQQQQPSSVKRKMAAAAAAHKITSFFTKLRYLRIKENKAREREQERVLAAEERKRKINAEVEAQMQKHRERLLKERANRSPLFNKSVVELKAQAMAAGLGRFLVGMAEKAELVALLESHAAEEAAKVTSAAAAAAGGGGGGGAQNDEKKTKKKLTEEHIGGGAATQAKQARPPMCAGATCVNQANLASCSRCKSVFYCSSKCQLYDWLQHKPICTKISATAEARALELQESEHTPFVKAFAFEATTFSTSPDSSSLPFELGFPPCYASLPSIYKSSPSTYKAHETFAFYSTRGAHTAFLTYTKSLLDYLHVHESQHEWKSIGFRPEKHVYGGGYKDGGQSKMLLEVLRELLREYIGLLCLPNIAPLFSKLLLADEQLQDIIAYAMSTTKDEEIEILAWQVAAMLYVQSTNLKTFDLSLVLKQKVGHRFIASATAGSFAAKEASLSQMAEMGARHMLRKSLVKHGNI